MEKAANSFKSVAAEIEELETENDGNDFKVSCKSSFEEMSKRVKEVAEKLP